MIEVRLRDIMRQRGISVPVLAARIDVHPSQVYALLKLPIRLHLPTLERVCRELQLTPGDVLVLVPGLELDDAAVDA